MAKYLDDNGLLYFWQKIKTIFAKQSDLQATNTNLTSLQNQVSGIVVPTNNNQLINGAGYQTASDVSTAISNAVSGITSFQFQVVTSLPASGANGTIYLVDNSGGSGNSYDEYIWIDSHWEKIGTTAVDLSGYWAKADLTAITNGDIDTILSA